MAASKSAQAVELIFSRDALTVRLADGRKLRVQLSWFPRLQGATNRQRENWKLTAGGSTIHWPDIDGDITVDELLATQ